MTNMKRVLDKSIKAVRQNMVSKVIRNTLETILRGTRIHPQSRALLSEVEVRTGVSYGPDPAHVLDVYRPKRASEVLPTVLYIHGGGFRILSKDTHWMMAALFARAGYTVFNMNYRLAPRYPYPAACEDVARAALWLKDHATAYGGRDDEWAVAGESAGGNLSLALAIANSLPRSEPFASEVFEAALPIRCVLPACGILQVSNADRFRAKNPDLALFYADRIEVVCRGYLPAKPSVHSLADPLVVLESEKNWPRALPPMMAIVGERDPIGDDSIRLGLALDELGVENEIRCYPGGGHAFHALFWRALSRQAWDDQLQFLKTHLPGSRGCL